MDVQQSHWLRCGLAYTDAGWHPFPLPHAKKSPPPVGYTGVDGIDASAADLYAWDEAAQEEQGIGLRAPVGVVGIDVDAYGSKRGSDTLATRETELGPLPDTYWSTSRDDGVSGIRWYRIPPDVRLVDRLGPDVEIIQRSHRYAVVFPSLHPEGRQYFWQRPDGTRHKAVPRVTNLPELPSAWVDALAAPVPPELGSVDVVADLDFLSAGGMSERMADLLGEARADLRGGSRHDATRDNVLRLLALSADGEPGGQDAITKLGEAFIDAVADRSSREQAQLEYARMVDGPRGQQLIAANHVERDESFWDRRPELKHIRTFAAARRLNPWAVLGAVLVRRLVDLPPNFVLPPLVGSRASSNMFVALVGPSGTSKSATFDAAADLTGDQHVEHKPVSGEAIARLFAYRSKDEQVWLKRSALCWYDEISTVGGVSGRSGGSGPMFRGNLCTAWSGGNPGQDTASPEKTVNLGKNTFRLCVAAGVQPDLAGFVLDHGGQGLPQRFLWLPVSLAKRERGVRDPGALPLADLDDLPVDDAKMLGPVTDIYIAPSVEAEIHEINDRRAMQGCDTLDAHSTLIREKVAVALSLLREGNPTPAVDEEAWELAGVVMKVSDKTRRSILDRLAQKQKQTAEKQGVLDGHRQEAAAGVVAARGIARVKAWAVSRLAAKGPMTRSALRKGLAGRDKRAGYYEPAIDSALAEVPPEP